MRGEPLERGNGMGPYESLGGGGGGGKSKSDGRVTQSVCEDEEVQIYCKQHWVGAGVCLPQS